MDFLTAEYASQPVWLWLSFLAFIGFLLWLDLGLLNRKDGVVSPAKSAMMWAGFASLALAFGLYVGFVYEPDPRFYISPDNLNQQAVIQYFTGYLLETALAFDNIFVISLIFTYFAVPREYQHRVLFWGIVGAIVFRALFISMGAAVVNSWTWVLYIFAAFLIWTGWKMLTGHGQEMKLEDNKLLAFVRRRMRVTETIENHNFFVRRTDPASGKLVLFATPLFLALIMVETADIVFAVDSVPAIFAVTTDPFIVYTSNVFAILGLRALYFALSGILPRFIYLKHGLALVLVLVGVKMLLADMWKMPTALALGLTVAILAGSIFLSIRRTGGTGGRIARGDL